MKSNPLPKTACPAHLRSALAAFIADFPNCQVRDKRVCYANNRVKQLRSTKHNHLAVQWDEIGNAFVLTAKGQRRQLLGGTEISR